MVLQVRFYVWMVCGTKKPPLVDKKNSYLTVAVQSTRGCCRTENLQKWVIVHGLLLFSCQLLISQCDAVCVQSYPDVCHSLISWGCLWKRFKRSSALYPSDMINPFRMLYGTGAAKPCYICLKCVPFQFVEKPSSLMNMFMKPTENAFCHVWLNLF